MTNKQIRKYAKEVCELEKIHSNPDATQEQKAQAEKRIIQITNIVMSLSPEVGMGILAQIDDIVTKELTKK